MVTSTMVEYLIDHGVIDWHLLDLQINMAIPKNHKIVSIILFFQDHKKLIYQIFYEYKVGLNAEASIIYNQ